MPRKKDWSNANLAAACLDVGKGMTPYRAEKKHGVPRKTIMLHMKGTTNTTSENQFQPAARLTRTQEIELVQWILRQEELGYPATARTVRSIVVSICAKGGDLRPLGRNWMTSFKKRNPSIATKIGKKQEAARFKASPPKRSTSYLIIWSSLRGSSRA